MGFVINGSSLFCVGKSRDYRSNVPVLATVRLLVVQASAICIKLNRPKDHTHDNSLLEISLITI